MNLFIKYNLWNFFSIMLTFLLKDFRKLLNKNLGEKIKISILKDKKIGLNYIPDKKWILIKNNIENTTSGKLRFLISNEDMQQVMNIMDEKKFLTFFRSIPKRLHKLTGINEIETFSFSDLSNPLLLGNTQKYYVVYILIKTSRINIILLFIIRDEMLLFPVNRFQLKFLTELSHYSYKKAFIELDKNIIWDGMQKWDKNLLKKMTPFIESYPAEKHRLHPGNNEIAYRLLLQYIHIIQLLLLEKNNL